MLILNYLFRDIILYTDLSRIFLILPKNISQYLLTKFNCSTQKTKSKWKFLHIILFRFYFDSPKLSHEYIIILYIRHYLSVKYNR